MNLKFLKVLLAASLLIMSAASVHAADDESPKPIIEWTTDNIMSIVEGAPEYFDDDPERFYGEIGAVLDKTIDWRGFARGVMGEYASTARIRNLDDAAKAELRSQLEEFTAVMKTGLIRTYAKGLLAFSGSKFEVKDPELPSPDARTASVTQLVYGNGGSTYTVRYQMGKYRDGKWRLRNLIVENINLGQIYQNQFAAAAEAASGDVAVVIATWDIASNLPEDLDDE